MSPLTPETLCCVRTMFEPNLRRATLLAMRILGLKNEHETRQSEDLFGEVCFALSLMNSSMTWIEWIICKDALVMEVCKDALVMEARHMLEQAETDPMILCPHGVMEEGDETPTEFINRILDM